MEIYFYMRIIPKEVNLNILSHNSQRNKLGVRFYYDLRNVLSRDYTWESVFRLRVSTGWKVNKIYGNYSIKSTDLLNIISADENKTVLYEIDLEDTVARENVVYF